MSDEFADLAIERQRLRNATQTNEALNAFQQAAEKAVYVEFLGLHGSAAVSRYPAYRDYVTNLRTYYRDRLPLPQQKIAFDKESRWTLLLFQEAMSRHYITETSR